MHENQLHEVSTFITLTYAPEFEPPGRTLVKKHFQDFMKRLRKASPEKIRFFHCGEYGETTQRPHYHAILFGIDFADKKKHSITKGGETTYTSELLERLWGFGQCMIGSVTPQSVRYVSSYILKKVTGEIAQKHYESLNLVTGEIIQRLPPYVTMSRRPGIGERWFARFRGDVFPDDNAIDAGKPLGVPRYYSRLHFRDNPQEETIFKKSRKRKAAANKANQTFDRLEVRRKIKLAQLKINERNEI